MNDKIRKLLTAGVVISLAFYALWAINPPSRHNADVEATYKRVAEDLDAKGWIKEIK